MRATQIISTKNLTTSFFCEDDDGNDYGEYVVKLKAGMEDMANCWTQAVKKGLSL